MTLKDHEEFECQRCGRCCRYIIKDGWVDVSLEVLEIWKKTPSLINHPFYMPNAHEFWPASKFFRGKISRREVWAFLESEERRVESLINEPVKFLWGGMLRYCPFLKRNGHIYTCLLHGEAKPHKCRDWPDINCEASVEEARSIGCKGIELLEAEV